MEVIEATEVCGTVEGMKQHSFGTAIMQKNTPGVYTYEFGQGKLDIESIVNYMMIGTTDVDDMISSVDQLSNILTDHAVLKRIFKNTFPSLTQQLTKNAIIMTTLDNNNNLTKSVGDKVPPGIIAALSESVVEIFADTSFVASSIGYSYREVRDKRVPAYQDLVREFMRMELVDVMKSVPLRIPIKSTKFNPAYLLAEFTTKASTLGRALSRIGYNIQHLHDSLYAVKAFFTEGGSVAHKIPADLVNSTEFGDLLSNVTFVQAAFESGISAPTTGKWNLTTAVRNTVRILNLSDRYSIVTLSTAVAPYRYEPITDGRSNLVGGTLSYDVTFKHPINIGLFAEVNTLQSASEAIPLTDYDQAVGAMIAPLQGKNVMAPAHEAVTQMLSALHIDTFEERPVSKLAVIDTLSPIDMFHLAAAYSDRIFIVPERRNTLTSGLVFSKDLKGKRLFADEIPFEGVVYTSEPATLLLSCDEFDATIPFDMGTQQTPPKMWETFMMDDDHELLHDFSGAKKVEMTIADQTVSDKVDISSLLRLVRRDNARMIKMVLSPKVFQKALSAPLDAFDYVMEVVPDELKEQMRITLETQLGHIINGFLSTIFDTDAVESVIDEMIRRMARKISPRHRDLTYQRLHQVNYRRQLDVHITFLLLTKLGLLTDIFGNDVISVTEQRVLKFLNETKFFERLIGTKMGKIE